MIIYNVTSKVDSSIADEWVRWMKADHIPGVMATGCFATYRFVKLLDVDEEEGPTYTVQYFAESITDYQLYINEHSAYFRKHVMDKCGNKYIAFRSLMQDVE